MSNPSPNLENLTAKGRISRLSASEKRDISRKGAIASNKSQKANKLFYQSLIEKAETVCEQSGESVKEVIARALIEKAKEGDLKAIEMFAKYTGGEPPVVSEKIGLTLNLTEITDIILNKSNTKIIESEEIKIKTTKTKELSDLI